MQSPEDSGAVASLTTYDRDNFPSAQQAVEYDLIDEVIAGRIVLKTQS